MSRRKTKKQQRQDVITFITLCGIVILSVIGIFQMGFIGNFFYRVFRVMLGQYPELFFGLIIVFSLFYLIDKKKLKKTPSRVWIALGLILYVFLTTLSFPHIKVITGRDVLNNYLRIFGEVFKNTEVYAYGGFIGSIFYTVSSWLFDRTGTIIINSFLGLISFVLLFTPEGIRSFLNVTMRGFFMFLKGVWGFLKKLLPAKGDESPPIEKEIETVEPEIFEPTPSNIGANFINVTPGPEKTILEDEQVKFDLDPEEPTSSKPRKSNINYQLPPLSLLENVGKGGKSSANNTSAREKGKRVIEVLDQFGIEAQLLDIHIGPSVTKFEIKPDSNVKINRIASIQDNMMMELAVTSLRIEAPIPGKAAVGIEIPNEEMLPVRLKEIIRSTPHFYEKENIWVALGKNLMGEAISIALNKMPHLLIAGATGSGKSVSINSIVSSLLLSKHPDDLKLVLIDPKKVEFTAYEKLPHLITPVVTDPHKASVALQEVVAIMEDRYEVFSKEGVRNITSYNEKAKQTPDLDAFPWIVVIIDELADLMAVAGKEVETSIQRITQLARAAGIHLIVATQRPSVDVITGVIKANIPSRIAFAVSSAVDSRTILDAVGAEKLLGYGDMLYIPMGAPSPVRVQGAFVSDQEVNAITQYASEQADPDFDESFNLESQTPESRGMELALEDDLYDQALELVLNNQRAATSYLQTYFGIGYNRAARIMTALEKQGIIGPQQGSKARTINFENYDSYVAQTQTEPKQEIE
ncbi:MAG TPA: DNA translocase FtsK [Erysipelothrix sp.]|nr:DNA translocase FtsK [Erysipelothrix sp.]